jgi:hypothetical protein
MQDFNLCSELSGFLIELAEVSDLPSQPPVIKVTDVAVQVHEVAAWPNKEGVEPGWERFNGVFFTMPNRVSLCIQVDNVRGLIRALLLMEPGNLTIFQLFNPFCWFEDSVTKRNEEVRDSHIVLDIPVGGAFKYVFIVLDTIVEPANLFLEVMDFDVFLGVASSDGCEEPFSDGSEDVGIEVRVCCQHGCNGTGQHRWFWTLDRANQERNVVFDG